MKGTASNLGLQEAKPTLEALVTEFLDWLDATKPTNLQKSYVGLQTSILYM